ncbi:unnamed protein product, partial [Polarella glacialis]
AGLLLSCLALKAIASTDESSSLLHLRHPVTGLLGLNATSPRRITTDRKNFIDTASNKIFMIKGPNIVVKGPPWFPDVSGDTICNDAETSTCTTFNKRDVQHIKDQGFNTIRLGVTWAGAQPTPDPKLDPGWVAKLYAILDLCESYGLQVLIDVVQNAFGSATCGVGVPTWFAKEALPSLIGKPLTQSLISIVADQMLHVYENGTCGSLDTESWAVYAGEDDYNLKNPCCILNNYGGWSQLTLTDQAQAGWNYLMTTKKGRSRYVTFLRLLASAVRSKPAAFAIELSNEPMSFHSHDMFATWQECYDVIQEEVPGMLVGVMGIGEAPISWWETLVSPFQYYWLRSQPYLFFAFHWYGHPASKAEAIKNTAWYSDNWRMPALMTEFMNCGMQEEVERAGIGWLYWHYSSYCKQDGSFGACVCGWASGESTRNCSSTK